MNSSTAESTQATKKRKLSSNELPPGSFTPPKSTKFWFQDGNIVLKTSTMSYRVHRGVLSIQSPVFEDMFKLPQPEGDTEPTIEGCPVVSVTDRAEDWDVLLTAFYNIESLYAGRTRVLSLQAMLAMLRLGQKYNLERFKSEALEQLRIILPNTLAGWDASFEGSQPEIAAVRGHEFEVLQAVEELQISSALPLAYFTCIRDRFTADIINGRDNPDSLIQVSQETRNNIIIGKLRLMEECPSRLCTWVMEGKPSAHCTSREACKDAMFQAMKSMVKCIDVADTIDPVVTMPHRFKGFCSSCLEENIAAVNAARQATFDKLPNYFGLPNWSELKDF